MFNTLLESKPKKQKTTAGVITSVVLHVLLIVASAFGTMQAKEQLEKPKEEKIDFVEVKKDEPPPPEPEKQPPPPEVVAAPPPPKGFQVLTAPIEIPDVIPDIDLSKQVTNEDDFSGKGVVGGVAKGVEGGKGPVTQDQPYFEFQVEKVAIAAPGNPTPAYPDDLRAAGITGEVLAQFVIDTTGRADMSTFKVLKADREQFALAVRRALPRYRFLPAEIGGKKVKMVVQMPFQFTLGGE